MPYQVEMAQATRQKLSPKDFVFPKEKKWPIQDVEQAKIALTWATWPQHKKVAKQVRDAVYKKYPQLKKKKGKKNESLGTLGSIDGLRGRLEAMKSLLGEQDNQVNDPESVAAVFNKENETEPKPLMEKPERLAEARLVRNTQRVANQAIESAKRLVSHATDRAEERMPEGDKRLVVNAVRMCSRVLEIAADSIQSAASKGGQAELTSQNKSALEGALKGWR